MDHVPIISRSSPSPSPSNSSSSLPFSFSFPFSLFTHSPRVLPTIPTLAELQKRAEEISHPLDLPASSYTSNVAASPPPSYAEKDPLSHDHGMTGGKLRKPRQGWMKVQECIPDHGVGGPPKMQSNNYIDVCRQPSIRQVVDEEQPRPTWLQWLTCRA